MSLIKKYQHLMGKIVLVKVVMTRQKSSVANGERVTWERRPLQPPRAGRVTWERRPLQPPRAGWVTGLRTVHDGIVKIGYGGEDPSYFTPGPQQTPCLLVVFWPNRNPVHVPLGGYNYFTVVEPQPDSRREWDAYEKAYPQIAATKRQRQREYAREAPRDEHGRFRRPDIATRGGVK